TGTRRPGSAGDRQHHAGLPLQKRVDETRFPGAAGSDHHEDVARVLRHVGMGQNVYFSGVVESSCPSACKVASQLSVSAHSKATASSASMLKRTSSKVAAAESGESMAATCRLLPFSNCSGGTKAVTASRSGGLIATEARNGRSSARTSSTSPVSKRFGR